MRALRPGDGDRLFSALHAEEIQGREDGKPSVGGELINGTRPRPCVHSPEE